MVAKNQLQYQPPPTRSDDQCPADDATGICKFSLQGIDDEGAIVAQVNLIDLLQAYQEDQSTKDGEKQDTVISMSFEDELVVFSKNIVAGQCHVYFCSLLIDGQPNK